MRKEQVQSVVQMVLFLLLGSTLLLLLRNQKARFAGALTLFVRACSTAVWGLQFAVCKSLRSSAAGRKNTPTQTERERERRRQQRRANLCRAWLCSRALVRILTQSCPLCTAVGCERHAKLIERLLLNAMRLSHSTISSASPSPPATRAEIRAMNPSESSFARAYRRRSKVEQTPLANTHTHTLAAQTATDIDIYFAKSLSPLSHAPSSSSANCAKSETKRKRTVECSRGYSFG